MSRLDAVLSLRRQGLKPRSVHIGLVQGRSAVMPDLDDFGTVHVDIAAHESLADIDFRPLTGLHVQIADFADDPARHRRAAKLIAEVEPALLVMPILSRGGLTLHRRWGKTAKQAAVAETTRTEAA